MHQGLRLGGRSYRAVIVDQDILGLEVPVHHLGAMHMGHRPEELLEAALADVVGVGVLLKIA